MLKTLFEVIIGISLMEDDDDKEEVVKSESTYPINRIDEENERNLRNGVSRDFY